MSIHLVIIKIVENLMLVAPKEHHRPMDWSVVSLEQLIFLVTRKILVSLWIKAPRCTPYVQIFSRSIELLDHDREVKAFWKKLTFIFFRWLLIWRIEYCRWGWMNFCDHKFQLYRLRRRGPSWCQVVLPVTKLYWTVTQVWICLKVLWECSGR